MKEWDFVIYIFLTMCVLACGWCILGFLQGRRNRSGRPGNCQTNPDKISNCNFSIMTSAIFDICFVPLLFSPPSNSPFLLNAITGTIRIILVTTHVIRIMRLAGFMAAGVLLWFVTSCWYVWHVED